MNKRTVSATHFNEVKNVAAQYVEALRLGNVEMMSDVFHPRCITYGSVDGELLGGDGNPTLDFIKNYGKSADLIANIDVLDITPTSAVVRVVMENDAAGSDCNDYLTLLKLDRGWKIIAKVFHQFDTQS